ncbi:hypothetical protein DL95DRAFT_500534 [Leptodontidium sp. 2 PMI_412]|nr:hypothetical protein DL95DRAFT_500534 [Leptodontidium sp. 2 PMI_412]
MTPERMSTTQKEDKKRIQNRLSQRAFRRRQAECMRDLKSRADPGAQLNSERFLELQQENTALRSQLVEVQVKLSRLTSTLQQLTNSLSDTLDTPLMHEPSESMMPNEAPPCHQELTPQEVPIVCEEPAGLLQVQTNTESLDGTMLSDIHDAVAASPYCQIPNIWAFGYQMGPQPYVDALARIQQTNTLNGKIWVSTNSPFSDHINLIEYLLKLQLDSISIKPSHSRLRSSLYQPVLMALAMFNSVTRPDVMTWYAKTRFYHIVELTAWKLHPSTTTFERLHERYQPTDIQLRDQYPQVIDWIPFPSIRNGLIKFHAANPQIDQIFCDAVSFYVVEARMSNLVLGAPPVEVYVRVTDLISNMGDSYAHDSDLSDALPAPDIPSLFASPRNSAAAFKLLGMDHGVTFYKMDPAFFDKYPELYDPRYNITAKGHPLKPAVQRILTCPKPLDVSMVETYRSFLDFTIGATHAIEEFE